MQRLSEVGVGNPFAFAGADALGTPEHVQEIGAKRFVRQHDGAVRREFVRGQPGKRRRAGGDLRDSIVQDLGTEASGVEARKRFFIVGVGVIGHGSQLIGTAPGDGADQVLQAEFAIHQILGKCCEQLGIGGRVGDTHIIEGIDDSLAEEMGPVAIGHGAGEEGILVGDHPVDQALPRVFASVECDGRAIEGLHDGWLLRAGVEDRTGALVENRLPRAGLPLLHDAGQRHDLTADLAEEGRHAPVIVLAPLFIGMVMALGAGHAHTQKELAGVVDKLLGLLHVAKPHGRGRLGFVADGRQNVAHKLVVRLILGNAGTDPIVESEGRERASGSILIAAFDAQDVGPMIGEIEGVFGRFEEGVDQLVALVWAGVREEGLDLVGCGQGAGDVQ